MRISPYAVLAAMTMHRLSAYNSGGADAAAAAAASPDASTEAASAAASAASGTGADASAAGTNASAAGTNAAVDETKAGAAGTVPEKYDLKLPEGSTLEPDLVTRTADTARALGLNNEAGQKLLDANVAEISKATALAIDKAKADQLEAMKPGGAVWTEQESQWRNQSLADAEIGGSPEKLQTNVDLANKVVNRFATEETKTFFQNSGLGSHPELIRVFARIGKQMSEATLARSNTTTAAATADDRLALRYPTMAAKS